MEQVEETCLKQLVRARNLLPYKVFVRVYEQAAKEAGQRGLTVERRQYQRWLAGELKGLPQVDACQVLEKIFGLPPKELFTKVPVVVMPVPGSDVIDVSPTSGAIRTAHESHPSAEQPIPSSLHELMMSAAEESRESAAHAETALGRSALEELETDVTALARTYLNRSPVIMFPMIKQLRDRVEAKTRQTRNPDQLRDLSLMNGLLCAMLSEASIDLGEHRMATDHARAAWVHGNNIGNVPLAVWARGMQATSSYWNDCPNDALIAVRRGEEHHPTGVAAARLSSIKARTWSHLGNPEQTLQAVREAQDARAAAQSGEDDLEYVGGMFVWDLVREERCASSAFLEVVQRRHSELDPAALRRFTDLILGHAERALAISQAAPLEERSAIVDATILLDMSTARLLLGDVSGAHDTLRPVLTLQEDMRTVPILRRLRGMRVPLSRIQATRAVHELADDLVGFASGSTIRALPPGSS
ncbi:hypothetical protein [Streptosporangium lutulentum]|uniref:XRE family transcriptional regulator n=1 Tax=Streptosporangium lutulentum TaxID=1461250 RepID=A0ABT9Q900_9ACTN|nr:hypothetical protein [Streptosporangium lutulentum]MDP9843227.1 hypothetical protein [Streptosporangium lutulentum]